MRRGPEGEVLLRYAKYIGILGAVALIAACLMPWVYIGSISFTETGFSTYENKLGMPGVLHMAFLVFFIACTFIQRIWAKRANILVVSLNIGWAIRNFFVLSVCIGGDCPEKRPGLYLMLGSSIVMLITALVPDIKIPIEKKN
jgi:hypothetical protein